MMKPLHKGFLTALAFSAFCLPLLAQTFSDWAPPVNLTAINTSGFEG
jgi:hypothetical protein